VKKVLKSIKGRIFLLLLTFTSFLLVAVGLFFYYEVKKLVFESVDEMLHSKAQVVSGLVHKEHEDVELEPRAVILGEYSIPRSGHYYKVVMNNSLLSASPSLVDPETSLVSAGREHYNRKLRESLYTSVGPKGEPVRVLRKDLEAFGKRFHVYVAESLEGSLAMMRSFRLFLLVVIPLGILVVCLAGWWSAKRSLNPLSAFSGRINAITHKSLGERIEVEEETIELQGLALAFNRMLARLQKTFESEKRLVVDASHELKTPTSIIRAQCDVTLQKERSKEEYIGAIRAIREVSVNIDALVRDLLSLARLDSNILLPEDFELLSLKELLKRTLEMVAPLAEQRRTRVNADIDDDVRVRGDRERLTEAFLNIAENGIKYNRINGELTVSARRNDGKAIVSISDTGQGIRADERERIFDRFYRSDSVRGEEGTGLGLSIVKAIIEAHGGVIRAEGEPGQGSTITVVLPGAE
jgi:heavy metal sensor kinase